MPWSVYLRVQSWGLFELNSPHTILLIGITVRNQTLHTHDRVTVEILSASIFVAKRATNSGKRSFPYKARRPRVQKETRDETDHDVTSSMWTGGYGNASLVLRRYIGSEISRY